MRSTIRKVSIAENSAEVRRRSCQGLEFIGMEIDPDRNAEKSDEERFIDRGSAVRVMVIPTNEELVIARDTVELIQ